MLYTIKVIMAIGLLIKFLILAIEEDKRAFSKDEVA